MRRSAFDAVMTCEKPPCGLRRLASMRLTVAGKQHAEASVRRRITEEFLPLLLDFVLKSWDEKLRPVSSDDFLGSPFQHQKTASRTSQSSSWHLTTYGLTTLCWMRAAHAPLSTRLAFDPRTYLCKPASRTAIARLDDFLVADRWPGRHRDRRRDND